jgi:septum formation protein
MRLVLASASPRRAELLRAAGFSFDVVPADVDERVRVAEPAPDYVRRLAGEKSAAVWEAVGFLSVRLKPDATAVNRPDTTAVNRPDATAVNRPDATVAKKPDAADDSDVIVLGADTTVVVDGEILGKPRDDREAAAMLRRLSGRRHDVMTGVSVRSTAGERGLVETTGVYIVDLREQDVAWYVASGEGRDKAGAYAIQGLASRFIPRIEGSYTNVVGLPVAAVELLMRTLASAG